MVYDVGIQLKQSGRTTETPQQRAKRVAIDLDKTYYETTGNSFDGNLKKTQRMSPLKKDGTIERDVWNNYVKENFNLPKGTDLSKYQVKKDISRAEAIKLLNTYYSKSK